METLRPRLTLVTPGPDEPCCCGSRRTFAACCASNLPAILDIGKVASEARQRDDKAACLTALRADLSKWIIAHRTTTKPAMLAGLVVIAPLVEADIANLSAAASNVAELMELTGEGTSVPAMIENLRNVVDDPRWPRRIIYLQTLHLWRTEGTVGAARRELAKLGPISPQERDIDVLRTAISLEREGRSLSNSLALYDRLFVLAESLDDRLRALGLKAAAYIEHGDAEQAKVELANAIALVPEERDTHLSWEETNALVWSLTHLGRLGGPPASFARAERAVRGALEWTSLPPDYRAVLFEALGYLFRHSRDPARAAEAYREALNRRASFPASIFLAESLLSLGQDREADVVLCDLDVSSQ